MGYSYSNTIPEPDSPFAAITKKEITTWQAFTQPAAALMADEKSTPDKVDQIKDLVINIHGPEIGEALIRYSLNLKNAVELCQEIDQRGCEAGAAPTLAGQPWEAMADEIRSAAASYRAAAEAAAELTGSAACTSSLCVTLPRAVLGRILSIGLACEADALDDLLDCLPAPDPKSIPTSPG